MKQAHTYTRYEFEYDIKAPTTPYGGYTIHFITADGGSLSYQAAKENRKLICEAIDERAAGEMHGDTQWLVVAKDVNWESDDVKCCHSGEPIIKNFPLEHDTGIEYCEGGWNKDLKGSDK